MKLKTLKPRLASLPTRLATLPTPSKRPGHRLTGDALRAARQRIWLRDMGACGECGKLCVPPEFHLDHRMMLDAGGTNDDSNLQILHVDCHKLKTKRELSRIE